MKCGKYLKKYRVRSKSSINLTDYNEEDLPAGTKKTQTDGHWVKKDAKTC